MKKTKLDFEIDENSSLENLDFSLEKPKNYNFLQNYNKDYIEKILEEHRGLKAKREVFEGLKKLNIGKNSGIGLDNPGVILEEFLIIYLEDEFLLDKKNPKKWEANKIDFFYGSTGVQLTTAYKNSNKINEIERIREKINSGENFYYTEEKGNGDIYKIPIENKEIPNNLALFTIHSEIITRLVSENNFFKTIENFSLEDFRELKENLDIIKKSFVQIQDKINFFSENPSELSEFSDKEYTINFDKNKKEINDQEIKKYYEGEKQEKPKNINMNSNITFSYDKKEKVITFKVYDTDEKTNQNVGTLIYEYKYFICNKVNRKNPFEKPELVSRNREKKEEENFNRTKKIEKIKKYINNFNQKLNNIKATIKKRFKIDLYKRKQKIVRKNLEKLKQENDYKEFIHFFTNLETEELDKINSYKFSKIKENKEKIEINKKITWLGNFIFHIENFLETKEGNLDEMGLSVINDKELLFKDPIFKRNNFLEYSQKAQKSFSALKQNLEELDIKGINFKKISQRLQKVLYVNATKSKSSVSYIRKKIKLLENKLRENYEEIEKLGGENMNSKMKNVKGGQKIDVNNNFEKNKKKPILELKKENKKIEIAIESLEKNLKELQKLRIETIKIDFDSLLISDLNLDNIIYNKEFLSDALISIIFEGEKVNKTLERKKLIEKLSVDNFEAENFLNLLDAYISFGDTLEENGTNLKPLLKEKLNNLRHIKDNLSQKVNEKIDETDPFIKEFLVQEKKLKEILYKIFPQNKLENYDNLIKKFLFDISGKNEDFIEKKLEKLIFDIGIDDLKENYEYRNLENFEDLKEEIKNIKNFFSRGISTLNKEELEKFENEIGEKAKELENLFNELENIYSNLKN